MKHIHSIGNADLPRFVALVIATSLTLLLGACASNVDPERSTTPPSAPAVGGLTTKDQLGNEVKLDRAPTSAMGFYPTDVDILVTLGFPLNPSQPVRRGYDQYPEYFPAEMVTGVKHRFVNFPEFNFEAFAKANPDFILNSFGDYKGADQRLRSVTQTYSYSSSNGRSWLENFKQTATDLERQSQYTAWLATYEQAGKSAADQIKKVGKSDFLVAPLDYRDGKLQIGCHNGVSCGGFRQAGLTLLKASEPRDVALSLENLDQLKDVDAVWVPTDGGTKDDEGFREMMSSMENNAAWKKLPFVQNNRIYTYDLEMSFGSPSGAYAFITQLSKDLAN